MDGAHDRGSGVYGGVGVPVPVLVGDGEAVREGGSECSLFCPRWRMKTAQRLREASRESVGGVSEE